MEKAIKIKGNNPFCMLKINEAWEVTIGNKVITQKAFKTKKELVEWVNGEAYKNWDFIMLASMVMNQAVIEYNKQKQ